MRFHDFSDDKLAEYERRIKRIKEKHPTTFYPSETPRRRLNFTMYLGDDKNAINMAAALGDTQLCQHIYRGNPEVIDAKYSENGDTPLMNAVQRKRLGTAEWLLQHGANILPNKKGYNPVLWACVKGYIPALNMFKHYGVDFNQPVVHWSWFGCPGDRHLPRKEIVYPIMLALRQPKTLQWLIDNGASIDVRYETGKSIRDNLEKHPERFVSECRKILLKKAAETPIPVQKSQKGFWASLGLGKTRA